MDFNLHLPGWRASTSLVVIEVSLNAVDVALEPVMTDELPLRMVVSLYEKKATNGLKSSLFILLLM
jgi:hypothetical protein